MAMTAAAVRKAPVKNNWGGRTRQIIRKSMLARILASALPMSRGKRPSERA